MSEFFTWITHNLWGMGAVIVGMIVLFVLLAVFLERRTRKLYPDRDRRGTKAVAKSKAKKAAAKSSSDDSDDNSSGKSKSNSKSSSSKSASKKSTK